MKLKFLQLTLVLVLFASCSKYENFTGYEELTDDLSRNLELVSSNELNANEAELFDKINTYRTSIGLNEMVFESTTYYYAGVHTDYMIQKGKMSHDNFSARAENISKRTGAISVAENVAQNYDTVGQAFEGWLNSPGHKKNIEGDFNYSAISIKPNNNGDFYFTQIFFR